jgi:NitT/TauT family transport system ATP-binding protein
MTLTNDIRAWAKARPGSLEIENLTVCYTPKGPPAVESIHLAVNDGEFVALVGPSGCGKSTVLNAAAGFVKPASGSIRIGGHTVTGPSARAAVVFQHHSLFPWMTALENVAFGPQELKFPRSREVALNLLDAVGLRDFAGSFPHELSGGMRQRVGVARALAVRPPLLLLDEPFGALDALTRELMQELLLRVLADSTSAVILVTHDVDEAIFLADRVVVMTARPGRIAREFEVPFARPRDSDLRGDPAFGALRSAVSGMIRSEGWKHFNNLER